MRADEGFDLFGGCHVTHSPLLYCYRPSHHHLPVHQFGQEEVAGFGELFSLLLKIRYLKKTHLYSFFEKIP